MTELSYIAKIKQALELAEMAKTGCSLTLFEVIELKGYIESLEETIALSDNARRQMEVALNEIADRAGTSRNADWARRRAIEALKEK